MSTPYFCGSSLDRVWNSVSGAGTEFQTQSHIIFFYICLFICIKKQHKARSEFYNVKHKYDSRLF
jgi:hypothetical protein